MTTLLQTAFVTFGFLSVVTSFIGFSILFLFLSYVILLLLLLTKIRFVLLMISLIFLTATLVLWFILFSFFETTKPNFFDGKLKFSIEGVALISFLGYLLIKS